MLLAGWLRIRVPIRSLHFSIALIIPAVNVALGSTQPLTEISVKKVPGG
jgi:hypothetical protein